MFSIFFRYGEEILLSQGLRRDIISLPPSIVVLMIPQIISHITHREPAVKAVVTDIINVIGSNHFEVVVYSLNVLSLLADEDKASVAREVLLSLGDKHTKLYADARLLIDGMHRSAITWLEKWLSALDTASRAQSLNDREAVLHLIQTQYDSLANPVCEQDQLFLRTFGLQIQHCRSHFERYRASETAASRTMWEHFRSLFSEMEEKMKKMDSVQLAKVSEQLASKRHFSLAVPGSYRVDGAFPHLESIEPSLRILATQQHPRIAVMTDFAGDRYKFLLKGNEDLRLDERIMQFFHLINSLLDTNRNTAKLGVSIIQYAIVPFAPNAGLIKWVTGADTIQQLVSDFRSHRDMRQNLEMEIAQQFVGGYVNSLSALQRLEIFGHVASQTRANEIREMLWLRAAEASAWLARNQRFTVSTALMSIAGYAIGLGDRHPSNIMVQRHTGRVIHIDFGDAFEVAMRRLVFAERVPFRLTRMMVNALDGQTVEGVFRRCCEDVLWVLKENMSSVIAQLEVFVHEPIFYGREIRPTGERTSGILERVAAKLSGNDPVTDAELEVGEQVGMLIKVAADPAEYVRHYIGWCPFW
jgi:phosphatidylinositol kinase/protein kinase (PI-3  family)